MLVEEVTKKSFEDTQLAEFCNKIVKRKLHTKLYNLRENELVSPEMKLFCYIQYGDVFWRADGVCQQCEMFGKIVYHLATRCKKMLGYDYTRRYNGVFGDQSVNRCFKRDEIHEEPRPLLRAAENEEDDELTININEDSELEEEKTMVK
ncbi:hypothetical protein CWI36_1480p0010 [Hamiltosporidium magnivora]|uniref:Uncharacterized protein n=1 Tax=Hamiltosporidium magnivora TaxID=148818 RepID=A0A4Q9L0U2_9MICR|nr:hypothetical protein CWI36_1480p0010 [Hamiltosporidium magnivora]